MRAEFPVPIFNFRLHIPGSGDERNVSGTREELLRDLVVNTGDTVLHDRDELRDRLALLVEGHAVERKLVAAVRLDKLDFVIVFGGLRRRTPLDSDVRAAP